jgi:chitin disaccharide deacetylase
MTADRWLIVNADDFGISPGVNRGIIHGHLHGIVTSTSLMVRREAARDAALAARRQPQLGVGLHLELGEWEQEAGGWRPTREVVDNTDAQAVEIEVDQQLKRFRSLVGADPTHLDSHQHVHRHEPARSIAADLADSLGVSLREHGPARYCGAFYGQAPGGEPLRDGIGPAALVSIIRGLPKGFTELCCHPSKDVHVPSSYAFERYIELQSLCDPRVRAALAEVGARLCTFRELVRPGT